MARLGRSSGLLLLLLVCGSAFLAASAQAQQKQQRRGEATPNGHLESRGFLFAASATGASAIVPVAAGDRLATGLWLTNTGTTTLTINAVRAEVHVSEGLASNEIVWDSEFDLKPVEEISLSVASLISAEVAEMFDSAKVRFSVIGTDENGKPFVNNVLERRVSIQQRVSLLAHLRNGVFLAAFLGAFSFFVAILVGADVAPALNQLGRVFNVKKTSSVETVSAEPQAKDFVAAVKKSAEPQATTTNDSWVKDVLNVPTSKKRGKRS